MTKFMDPKFSSRPSNDAYRKNFGKAFRNEMSREEKLEKALQDLLNIFESSEMEAMTTLAVVHGYRCEVGASLKNGQAIEAAKKLLVEK